MIKKNLIFPKKTSQVFLLLLSFLMTPYLLFSNKLTNPANKSTSTYLIKHMVAATIDSSINPATYSYLESAYKKAHSIKNSAVLIKLNTPGGLVSTTKKILTLMGEAQVPTIVWITPEAASATSAGALIAAGSHFLLMSEGTNIGAATPIDMGAKDLGQDIRSKAINDLVALISSLSQTRGRNPEMFANMVKEAASYTSQEAKEKGIINGIANDIDAVYKALSDKKFTLKGNAYTAKIETVKVHELPMDLGQKILNIFADPNMAYILFLLGAALIYFEFQAPGTLIPGAIGALLLILSGISFQVLPLNFGALGLLVLAFILFIIEAYVTSYGALSIAGLCSLIFGSLFLFRTNDSYLTVSHNLIVASTLAIALFLLFIGLYIYWDSRSRKTRGNYYSEANKVALITEVVGYNEQLKQYQYLVKVEGELWQAYSHESYEKGHRCRVIGSHKKNMSLQI